MSKERRAKSKISAIVLTVVSQAVPTAIGVFVGGLALAGLGLLLF